MNAQLALELADFADEEAGQFEFFAPHPPTAKAYKEIAAILRHYAEIMQAEPVMYAPDFGDGPDHVFAFATHEDVADDCDDYIAIVPLIAKPKPLEQK